MFTTPAFRSMTEMSLSISTSTETVRIRTGGDRDASVTEDALLWLGKTPSRVRHKNTTAIISSKKFILKFEV